MPPEDGRETVEFPPGHGPGGKLLVGHQTLHRMIGLTKSHTDLHRADEAEDEPDADEIANTLVDLLIEKERQQTKRTRYWIAAIAIVVSGFIVIGGGTAAFSFLGVLDFSGGAAPTPGGSK